MKFYTRYKPKPRNPWLQENQISRTRQSEKDNCDVNKIMERFNREGKLPVTQSIPPQYGDARVPDFQTSKAIISEAERNFRELPSATRKHFNHDPMAYLAAVDNPSPEQAQKLLELGILVERKPTTDQLLTDIVKNTKSKPENSEKK